MTQGINILDTANTQQLCSRSQSLEYCCRPKVSSFFSNHNGLVLIFSSLAFFGRDMRVVVSLLSNCIMFWNLRRLSYIKHLQWLINFGRWIEVKVGVVLTKDGIGLMGSLGAFGSRRGLMSGSPIGRKCCLIWLGSRSLFWSHWLTTRMIDLMMRGWVWV